MISKELSSSSEPTTLEEVKAQFDHWRATRSKNKKMPSTLWEAASQLIKQYDYRQIAAELNLNPNKLHTVIKQYFQKKSAEASKHDFVELSVPSFSLSSLPSVEQKKAEPPTGTTLECTRPDGAVLKASGLDSKDLYSFIQGFLGP